MSVKLSVGDNLYLSIPQHDPPHKLRAERCVKCGTCCGLSFAGDRCLCAICACEEVVQLHEALGLADAALNSAVRHLLGTGPVPDPTMMAHATSAVAKAHKAIRSASATTRAPTRSEVHLRADHGKD